MATDEQVVVGNRRGEEILAHDRGRLDPYLRTTHVLLILALGQRDVHRQQTLHVTAQFNQRVVTGRQLAVNSHTDTRLEMRGVLVLLRHLQRDRTVRQQHLTILLDTGQD